MKKTITEGNSFRIRRNSSFVKVNKFEKGFDDHQTPLLPVEGLKTLKLESQKKNYIPSLNFEPIFPKIRPKLYSVEGSLEKAIATQRLKPTEEATDDSFNNLKNTSFVKTKEKVFSKEINELNSETKSKFPLISKKKENIDRSETTRKKSRNFTQCKILISRKNNFPFIGQNYHRMERKQKNQNLAKGIPEEFVKEEPFILDSMDTEIEVADEQEPFLSKESLQELLIF